MVKLGWVTVENARKFGENNERKEPIMALDRCVIIIKRAEE